MRNTICNICLVDIKTTVKTRPLCQDCHARRRIVKKIVEENKDDLTDDDLAVYHSLIVLRNKVETPFIAYKSNITKRRARKSLLKLYKLGIVKKDKRLYYV